MIDTLDGIADLSLPLQGIAEELYSPYPNTTELNHSCTCASATDALNFRPYRYSHTRDAKSEVVPSTQPRCANAPALHATLRDGVRITIERNTATRYFGMVFVRPLRWRNREELDAQTPSLLPWRRMESLTDSTNALWPNANVEGMCLATKTAGGELRVVDVLIACRRNETLVAPTTRPILEVLLQI